MKPLVSVVVPIYNIAPYLPQCVDSILCQTLREIEIILVNDGSTDQSGTLCDQYAQIDPRVRVVHKANGGLISARKAGAKIANGEYIGCVDGDDFIEPGMYEALIKAAVESNAQIALCAYYHYNGDTGQKQLIPPPFPTGVLEKEELAEKVYPRLFVERPVPPNVWSKLFKREPYLECLFAVDDRISQGEDIAVSYPMLLRCNKLAIVEEPLYNYRVTESSMSHGYRQNLKSSVDLIGEMFDKIALKYGGNLADQMEQLKIANAITCIQNEGKKGSGLYGGSLYKYLCEVLQQYSPQAWKAYRQPDGASKKEKLIVWLARHRQVALLYIASLLNRFQWSIRATTKGNK